MTPQAQPTRWSARWAKPLVPALISALLVSGMAPQAWAQDRGRDGGRDGSRDSQRDGDRDGRRGQDRNDHRHDNQRGQGRDHSRDQSGHAEAGRVHHGRDQDRERGRSGPDYRAPVVVAPAPHRGAAPRWVDNAHGHRHAYPPAGWVVNTPPPRARRLVWAGVPYWYDTGVWYGHGPRGYAVVRPPRGLVVFDLPSFRSVVLVAGLAYLYANGTYYLERPQGGYEVVEPPQGAVGARGMLMDNGGSSPLPVDKVFVYPRQGQSAQQQANDEYDCHRWARNQVGFDPAATAVGQAAAGSASERGDYERARGACLDARGYTVR